MNYEGKDESVNWSQIRDLIGDEGDATQHAVLANMWLDMSADVRKDWAALDKATDESELRKALHRVRGVVSMWGLGELAASMQTIENEARPLDAWRRSSGALVTLRDRGMEAITARFPWLNGGAS
jgi:HPt (histidine-containing phosphotransfer) domain-containing protein